MSWANWRAQWDKLAPRERGAVLAAALLVAAALLWWVLLAPALQTLRDADRQHAQLDIQLQKMRSLQAEAQTLQSSPKLSYDDALRALEASVRQRMGGTAQLSVVGDRATVTLKGASAEALAQWLAQARINARALPAEARLVRSPAAAGASGPAWDGTLVLSLPAR
ncbi:MAG TPA: type II secretion system protein GspM [Burkholderiaceae bacterium]|nr:type II secretion system protein GspM [Burkholderiaceae bacterium]